VSILWAEAREIPAALSATLERRDGFDDVVAALSGPNVRRIVAIGNGAAYYGAMAFWLASLAHHDGPEVVALPAGLVATSSFHQRSGDVILAVSTSGEFRDVVAVAQAADRVVAITGDRRSSLGRAAAASAVVAVRSQGAATHTQAYCSVVATALSLAAALMGDRDLEQAVRSTPATVASALDGAEAWAAAELGAIGRPAAAVAFGGALGWPAAMETALLLKEVARVPAEGAETREGATSSMYGLAMDHLVLTIGSATDPLLAEAEAICASTGANVLRLPGGDLADSRLVGLLSFPGALALAIGLAERAGIDVDAPDWLSVYAKTSRGVPEIGEGAR
jgi:glucosamine 6-phosphate synthetase-like amidotransferase/phosphosugar isomerase protein